MCSLKATLLRQLRLVTPFLGAFGIAQSLKFGVCSIILRNSPSFLYFNTTIAVFPNRFETRLLPTKRLNVFWVGTIFRLGVRAWGVADSYRPQTSFFTFQICGEHGDRTSREKYDFSGIVSGDALRFHIPQRTRHEDAAEAQENTQYL